MNISLIVIGRNEGNNLKHCFDSISKVINNYIKLNFECIYIDSDSMDNSAQIAIEHPSVNKVIKLTGEVNSAIARNVGVYYSKGEILFFIDGDMVLAPEFLKHVIDFENKKLIHPIVTGDLINIIDGKESYYYGSKLHEDRYSSTTGGVFIIERKIWVKSNGMDPRFKRSQDLAFFFNLSLEGILVLRKKELICYHNAIPYHSRYRIISALHHKYSLYSGLFYRKYFFKSYRIMPIIFRRDYSSLFLLFLLSISIFYNISLIGSILYFAVIVIRNFLAEKRINLYYLLYRIISDFYVLLGFLFFYPKRNKKFELIILKK